MAIFASTTTSGYSDPLKAYSIKALEQRQKDMQAQMAAQQPDAAMMATIPGGIGHVLGQVGDRMAQSRNDAAVAARRQELAATMAGIGPEGPTPQQLAQISSADPELGRTYLQQIAAAREAEKSRAATAAEHAATRTQQKELATQSQTHASTESGLTRAQQKELATQGQTHAANLAADADKRARELQAERLAAEAANEEKKLAAAQATAAADPAKAGKVAELEQQLTQKDLMVNELTRAEEALNKGINVGISGQIATGISKLPGGGYLADKEQGQRTELFDNTMNKVATGAMSNILKGQSTDFEMKKFQAMYNNPNIPMEAKRQAFADVLAAAKKDREIEARAVKKVGGDVTRIEPAAAAPAAAAPAAVKAVASEAEALQLEPGTKFKLPDGRTGTAR